MQKKHAEELLIIALRGLREEPKREIRYDIHRYAESCITEYKDMSYKATKEQFV